MKDHLKIIGDPGNGIPLDDGSYSDGVWTLGIRDGGWTPIEDYLTAAEAEAAWHAMTNPEYQRHYAEHAG